jgi:phage major head subunit gpT-like protein
VRVNLSRQMLVNDTLDSITQVLNSRGDAVAHFEDTTFYTMLLSGSNSDGPTLLETSRQVFNTTDTTKASSNAAITVASVGLGRAALRKKTSLNGQKLNVPPTILLVGPNKEVEAEQLVAPIQAQQSSNINPFSGRLSVVVTAQLTGNVWYLFADPSRVPCFEWGLLEGYTAPRFRMDEPFGVQGIGLSLEHDFGCGAIDFRGGYKNAGA